MAADAGLPFNADAGGEGAGEGSLAVEGVGFGLLDEQVSIIV